MHVFEVCEDGGVLAAEKVTALKCLKEDVAREVLSCACNVGDGVPNYSGKTGLFRSVETAFCSEFCQGKTGLLSSKKLCIDKCCKHDIVRRDGENVVFGTKGKGYRAKKSEGVVVLCLNALLVELLVSAVLVESQGVRVEMELAYFSFQRRSELLVYY